MANRIIEVMCAMYGRAPRWGFDVSTNPAESIDKFREVKRKRFVTEEELPALARAIDAEPNVYVRSALWVYLLSGARKSELLEARWDQIDWDRGILNLPDTKSGEAQTVALSKPAIAILRATPELEDNEHIFPGKKEGRHLVNIDKPWGRIRKAAAIEDVRIHDLGRTVGSWLTQDNVDLKKIKDALRRASISTTLTYARLGADPAREAMESHGEKVMQIAGKARPVGGGGT